MYYNLILVLILFLSYIYYVKSIHLNSIVFEYYDTGLHSQLTNDFNEYSIKNNLNITLELTMFTNANSTVLANGDRVTIQSLLSNRSKKYDIYLYILTHAPEYAEHLMDLKDYISPDVIKMYSSEVFNKTCYINDRLIGFPINFSFSVLYSNEKLLNKYNCTIPETWDDFLDTLKLITKEERNPINNNNISGYTGLFGDDEGGSNTIYEMLYSYRKSEELPYPDLHSPEAKNSLEMLKKIFNEISSNDDFLTNDGVIASKYYSGRDLFLKYWYMADDSKAFKKTPLPGWKKGISASSLGGTNIGISMYSDEEKKKAAIEVVKFMISKEEQKRIVMKQKNLMG
ncbi:periplasmic binding protein-like II, partial [Anaeromyces robustus]